MPDRFLKHSLGSDFPGLFEKLEEIHEILYSGSNDTVFKNGIARLIFQFTQIGTKEISADLAREILWEAAGLLLEMEAITSMEFKAIDAMDERLSRKMNEEE